ncbi:MAG: Endonuclease [Betaproteobacteria bacterium]|nr:Endonuclease [Betaproteobacteria bacterium]
MQFNMQFGQVWDDADPDHAPLNLDLAIGEIRRHDADIVILQEVEQARAGGEQTEPAPNHALLKAALPGYDSYFSYPKKDPRELPFGIGLAIFSKTPLRAQTRVVLPSPAVEFEFAGKTMTPTDRLLIGATTTIGGREVHVFDVHLLAFFMLKSSSEQHMEQRTLVLDALRACKGPTLLAGDFNVSKHDSLLQQFGRGGFHSVQKKEITWRRRPYVLDHIFYSKELRPLRHEVLPTPASDHHILVADFEFT